MTANAESLRSVASVTHSERMVEGGGFVVRRPFPTGRLLDVDPFLLLDEMGPVEYAPGEAIGAPDHPHRGFETVTYLLSGAMQHKDSRGHAGRLTPGDVQWMTAGAGVVHSEMPADEFQTTGGLMHGFQIWVNLPARDKMMPPRYQEIPSNQIPTARSADGLVTARVIAGEAMGVSAVIDTRTPIAFVHYIIQPGGSIRHRLPREYGAFAYVFAGDGEFGQPGRAARSGDLVRLAADGDDVAAAVPSSARESMEFLLLGGVPIREPVARYGPFVMNTQEQILQAFRDYQTGRMGQIDF